MAPTADPIARAVEVADIAYLEACGWIPEEGR